MFGIGAPELLIVLIIVLIIFGAGKLPNIGAGLGSGIRNFRKAVAEPREGSEKKNSRRDRLAKETAACGAVFIWMNSL